MGNINETDTSMYCIYDRVFDETGMAIRGRFDDDELFDRYW